MGKKYKELLPKELQPYRWGSFIDAFQDLTDDFKDEKVKPFLNRFDIEKSTDEQIKEMFEFFGFDLSSYNGYTTSRLFLKRQLEVLQLRKRFRKTRKGYHYVYYIYNLKGDILPTINMEGFLQSFNDYWDSLERTKGIENFDVGVPNILYYLNGNPVYANEPDTGFDEDITFDIELLQPFDSLSAFRSITKNLVLDYSYRFAENEDNYMTFETSTALYEDMKKQTRNTDVLFFRPNLNLELRDNQNVYNKPVNLWSGLTYERSLYVVPVSGGDVYNFDYPGVDFDDETVGNFDPPIPIPGLLRINRVKFGDGKHSALNPTITDLANPLKTFNLGDFVVLTKNANVLELELKMNNTLEYEMVNFNEVGLFQDNEIIAYFDVPKVNYGTNQRKTIKLKIRIGG